MKDEKVNSFISLLLSKNAQSRTGGSFANLKKHAAFEKISWHDLIGKTMKPKFDVPKDKLIDLEKLKLKTKPLKSVLKAPTKVMIKRKDLSPSWD